MPKDPSTVSSYPSNGVLGTFFSFTGKNPKLVASSSEAFTPWEASIDRATPPPAADLRALAFGGGNLTQSRLYRIANLPPYNARRGAARGISRRQKTDLLEIGLGVAVVAAVGFLLCKNR